MTTIYIFANGGIPGLIHVSALCECGDFIAGHACSHEGWAAHDMGITSDWKHDTYRKHLDEAHGGGEWLLVWVPTDERRTHAGMNAAYARHCERYPEPAEEGGSHA